MVHLGLFNVISTSIRATPVGICVTYAPIFHIAAEAIVISAKLRSVQFHPSHPNRSYSTFFFPESGCDSAGFIVCP